jgi:hypothetical protein
MITPRDDILSLLATGKVNDRETALVERPPPSGFTGSTGAGPASVTFATDDAERVVVMAESAEPGFLLLADQCYPGWYATVNGASTPILCANLTFRLVEIPAGRSIVEFRYRPRSVYVGAIVSVLTLVVVVSALLRQNDRASPSTIDAPAPGTMSGGSERRAIPH